jgi:Flp pilus assembly protein TadB
MRALIFLAVVVLILAFAGWISFSKSAGRSSINIETQQIKQDTDRAVESGSNLLRKAGEAVDQTNEPQTAPTPPPVVR